MRKTILSLVVATTLIVSYGSLNIASADSSEKINNFGMNVDLAKDGYATITETIDYDFGSNSRHGVFRDIPLRYYVDDTHGYQQNLVIFSVLRDGSSEEYNLEDGIYASRIKIGRADVTISGNHQYVINYTLGPLPIIADDETNIVRINSPGTNWDVDVEKTRLIIKSQVAPTNSFCYQGIVGSTQQDCLVESMESQIVISSSRVISPGQTITSEVVYPADSFTDYAVLKTLPNKDSSVQRLSLTWVVLATAFMVGLVAVGLRILIIKYLYRRRRKQETVIARYTPPIGFSPAELGLLIDNSVSGVEISATLINLAVRGYLRIDQTKAAKWYKKAEYNFVKLKAINDTENIPEKDMFKVLFGKQDTISLEELRVSTKFSKMYLSLRKKLIRSLAKKGYYRPVKMFSKSLNTRMTDEGYEGWAQIAGFRKFLEFTEKDRMEYLDNPDKNPKEFSEYLPYAIAMGVEKKWAAQFSSLTGNNALWIRADKGVDYLGIAKLSVSLTHSLNAATNAASSSGTSSGGGGFSGGGFSGGGGGSW